MLDRRLAEIVFEAWAASRHFREDEAAMVVDVANRRQALRGLAAVECGIPVAVGQRQGGLGAVCAEAPGMIRATEEAAGVAAGFRGDAGALVGTAVVQDMDRMVFVADHQHGLGADGGAEIVARVRDLRVMADIDPGVGEQPLHLQGEDFGVGVDVAVHFGVPDQGAEGFWVVAVAAGHAQGPFGRQGSHGSRWFVQRCCGLRRIGCGS